MKKENHPNRSNGSNETERVFASTVLRAGLIVEPSPSIRCKQPVLNKRGVPVKTVTTPDYLVTDPISTKTMYVEVTHGNGSWPSKKAQKRVVLAAGIENYIQLTGNQIQTLLNAPTPEAIRSQLFELFHWKLTDQNESIIPNQINKSLIKKKK